MTTPQTAEIIDWDPDSGSGYLGLNEQNQLLPLKVMDFEKFHRRPVVGDRVLCDLSYDADFNPVAVDVRLLRAKGLFHGMSTAWPSLFLVLPIVAFLVAPLPASGWHFMAYLFLVSAVSFLLYHCDDFRRNGFGKMRADSVLHFLELIGGWPGAILARRKLGVEQADPRYQLFLWLSVALWQGLAIEAMCDWSVTQQVWSNLSPLLEVVNPLV